MVYKKIVNTLTAPNEAFKQTAYETLAQMTGLRVSFIKEHQEKIKTL